MELQQSKVWGQVGRKKQIRYSSQVHVTFNMEFNPFGTLHSTDTIFFESEARVEQLEGVVVPSATPLDEVIEQIGNAVVLG